MDQKLCKSCCKNIELSPTTVQKMNSCGHLICIDCIKPSASSSQPDSECQHCSKMITFRENYYKAESELPKNHPLIKFLHSTPKSNRCKPHPNNLFKCVCVDSNCKLKKPFCSECISVLHPNCDKNRIFSIEDFSKVCLFKQSGVCQNFNSEKLKTKIIKEIKDLENSLIEMVDQTSFILKQELEILNSAEHDILFFIKNLDKFEIEQAGAQLEIKLKNEQYIGKFVNHLEIELNVHYWEQINSRRNSILSDRFDCFQQFNSESFKKNKPILGWMVGLNYLLLSDLVLNDFKLKLPFSYQSYFASLLDHLSIKNIEFEEQVVYNFSLDTLDKFKKEISGAFKQPFVNFEIVENFLKKSLEENVPGFCWTVKFCYGNFVRQGPTHKKYVYLYKNCYSISVFGE